MGDVAGPDGEELADVLDSDAAEMPSDVTDIVALPDGDVGEPTAPEPPFDATLDSDLDTMDRNADVLDVSRPVDVMAEAEVDSQLDLEDTADSEGIDAVQADLEVSDDVGPEDSEATDTEGATSPPLTLIIGVDQADSTGAETSSIVLAVGQGWVNQFIIPKAGQIVGFQASVGAPFGPSSCALFQPALWVASPQMNFSDSPTWIDEAALALQPTPEPLVWLLAEPIEVLAGTIRFGLVASGPCAGSPPAPSLDTGLSGDNSAAYIYAPNPGGGAWIPGDAFGLAGNWVLRLLVEVPKD